MRRFSSSFRKLLVSYVGTLLPGRPGDDGERGDVPGWVMITLMSAVLVAGLLALAGPALQGLFESAIGQVSR
ncbi:hypothetical protein [Arthrobacter sp. Br18]|uniref:hypothetical protein n=1 Tax=Arthrobacter sp. Br18 TaxID=1312954 RepID=UPI00055F038E|nr:hypothetical protein [Arthrobacter sp. Br18]